MTEEDLVDAVREGRGFFAQKKTASLYAVANVYLVWRGAAPASAPPQARSWLREELSRANDSVKAHNVALRNDRENGLAVLAGKLTEEDLASHGAADPEEEKARLVRLALLGDAAFKSRLRVPIRLKEGDDDVSFNAVVRFVFELYSRTDAPLVSRYAMVLEGIDKEFGGEDELEVEWILDWMKAAGGFEAILHAQREQKAGDQGSGQRSSGKSAAKGQGQKSDQVTGPTTEEFRSDTIVVTMRMPSWLPELPEGPVSLHCICTGPEEIEVIGFNHLDDDGLSHVKAHFSGYGLPPANSGSTVPDDADEEQAAAEDSAPETVD